MDLNSPDYWIRHMRQGDFEKAWEFSDAIIRTGLNRNYENLPRHYQCIWDGSPIAGKRVLIRCYHGLGDTIMFIRYALKVKEIAKQVIVWAQPELTDLLKTTEGIDRLIPLHNGSPQAEYDTDVEVMELPHVFRTLPHTIPARIPYMHAEPFNLPVQGNKNAGIVWQVSNWDTDRNIPFSLLEPLFGIEGINFYILQQNAGKCGWNEGFGIHPGEFDLYRYARFVKSLDLLITVDSMPAHLAGALNVPVWVMLKHSADWRWMENRSDSPWYPSMRLFRQSKENDWEGVVRTVEAELQKWSHTPNPASRESVS